ncbi:hypothetical protein GGS24DRAFT_147074 [Hypoxylon argillaceum]|nr:hypothetical protein GGS24DRAFT_147074 [Hypoxylon argillaceum]
MSTEGPPSTYCRGYQVEAFVGGFTALEAVAVAIRFWARSISVAKYDLGDYLIAAAFIGQLGAGALGITAVKLGGVGCHIGYVVASNPELLTNLSKILLAVSTWYAATESLAKLAVCLFYKQVFIQRWVHWVVNITILALILTSVIGILIDLLACTPFSAHWGSAAEQAQHCRLDDMALSIWAPFSNTITDVVLLVIPIPILWHLNAPLRLRVSVILTFLLGSIGLITSIFRFVVFLRRDTTVDPTYHAIEPLIWTICEPGVYLIAACLLVYRPLIERFASRRMARKMHLLKGSDRPIGQIGHGPAAAPGPIGDSNVALCTIGGTPFQRLEEEDKSNNASSIQQSV